MMNVMSGLDDIPDKKQTETSVKNALEHIPLIIGDYLNFTINNLILMETSGIISYILCKLV